MNKLWISGFLYHVDFRFAFEQTEVSFRTLLRGGLFTVQAKKDDRVPFLQLFSSGATLVWITVTDDLPDSFGHLLHWWFPTGYPSWINMFFFESGNFTSGEASLIRRLRALFQECETGGAEWYE